MSGNSLNDYECRLELFTTLEIGENSLYYYESNVDNAVMLNDDGANEVTRLSHPAYIRHNDGLVPPLTMKGLLLGLCSHANWKLHTQY